MKNRELLQARPWILERGPWFAALLWTLAVACCISHTLSHEAQIWESVGSLTPGQRELLRSQEAHIYIGLISAWIVGLAALAISTLVVRKQNRRRVAAIQNMADNEQRYRQLFDHAPIACLSMDANGGNLTINEACSELLGCSQQELTGRRFGDLVNSQGGEAVMERLELTRARPPRELTLMGKGGSAIQVLLHARAENDADGRCQRLHCMLLDVTGKKEAKKALEESETRFRLISENSADIIWIYNLGADSFEYVSPAAERVLGFRQEQIVGQPLAAFLSPASESFVSQDLPDRLASFAKGDQSVGNQTFVLELHTCWGRDITAEVVSTIVPDDAGMPVRLLGLVRDISARKAQETAISALLQCTAGKVGEEFASVLVRELANALDVEYVFLSRRVPGRADRLQTQALWAKGRLIDNIEYDITDSPCSRLRSGVVCHVERSARERHPRNLLFRQLKIEAYLAAPLLSRSGDIIGALVAMDSRPLAPMETQHSLLTVFAARASAEIERSEAIEALAESESRFRKIIENSHAGYFRIGLDRRFEDVNQAWLELHGYSSRGEIVGKHFSLSQTQEDLPAAVAIVERIFSGYMQPPGEVTRRRKDGTVGYHTLSAGAVSQGGTIIAMEGFIIDSTALRQARNDYAKIFKEMVNGFCVHEIVCDDNGQPVDFRFLSVNPAFEKLLGIRASRIIGKCAREVFPEMDDFWVRTYAKVALQGEPVSFERNFLADSRSFSISAFQSSPGCFAATFTDITERKQAEMALARDEAELQAINAHVPLMLFLLETDGRVRRCNKAAADFSEQAANPGEEARTGSLLRCIHAFESPSGCAFGSHCEKCALRVAFTDTLLRGTTHHREETSLSILRGEEVQSISLLFSTARLAIGDEKLVLLCLEDVTPQKKAEEQVRQQAALLDITHDAICVLSADYAIDYWNRGAERTFGWTAAEAVGCDWETLIFKQESSEFRAAWNTVVATGEWMGELQALTKEGKAITLQCRVTRVDNERQSSMAALFVCTDVTEAKIMEAKLLHMQRIDSLGSIASGIAHDLNNILSPILMSVDLLPARLPAQQDRALVEMLRASAKRGAEIVQQLLVFSRGSNTPRQPIDPSRLVCEMAGIVRQTFPQNIELAVDVVGNPWLVVADSTQMHQVLLNLCVNARDAMDAGGTLTLRVENTTVDKTLAPGGNFQDPWVLFTIRDTGAGIPSEYLDKIFDPFFTTKPEGKGTGLGLSTALGIIKNHGGQLRVTSKLGKGSEFLVYIPALPEGDSRKQEGEITEDCEGKGETILLVDDEESVQHLILLALEKHNYKVLHASDGARGVALYSQHSKNVRLAMIDMMMPHMDGKLTIQCVRKIDGTLPIIAMSGMAEQESVVQKMEDKRIHFALKPFTMKKMLALIRRLLDESH